MIERIGKRDGKMECRIARIAGAGVAGSYLHALLENMGVDLPIYDASKRRGCTCAFGCFYTFLKEKLSRVGLNVDDYILCRNTGMYLDGVWFDLRNQISIDKPRLVKDLCRDVEPRRLDLSEAAQDSQWTVNATGIPVVPHFVIPTRQYRVKISGFDPAVNYIYLDNAYVGYAWAFSLDEDAEWFHLGAGCVNEDPEVLIRLLCREYNVRVEKKACCCDRPIRVVSPLNMPMVHGKLVSVGEAGGYVFPLTGEGIIPAMDSVDLLLEAWGSGSLPDGYAEASLEYFKENSYQKAVKVWKMMRTNPQGAWLSGFRFMYRRTRRRAQPKVTLVNGLKLLCILMGVRPATRRQAR